MLYETEQEKEMNALTLVVICICSSWICIPLSYGFQNTGEDFGESWLEKYGDKPISTFETPNDLWNWGNVPKGFQLHNGTLYPPGTWAQWYYPSTFSDYTPIIMNKTDSSNLLVNNLALDPWLMAQLSGRPVYSVNEPKSTLF